MGGHHCGQHDQGDGSADAHLTDVFLGDAVFHAFGPQVADEDETAKEGSHEEEGNPAHQADGATKARSGFDDLRARKARNGGFGGGNRVIGDGGCGLGIRGERERPGAAVGQ